MDRRNITPYLLTEEKEQKMWETGVFVFDTSTLLQFYYHSKKAQDEIFNKTFEKISKRLWIPNQVEFEFLKNRENALRKPIDEKYERLRQEQLNPIRDSIKKAKVNFQEFQKRTSNEDTHPYLDKEITRRFNEYFQKFEKHFDEFQKQVDDQIETRIEEINFFSSNDTVLDAFEKYFSVGRAYSYVELIEIVQEGELRYKFKIPPGYQDYNGKYKKEGLQIFGDLFIWKQILEYSKDVQQPIIFIANDVKDDWCYVTKRNSETRIDRPREELVKEIRDTSGVDFWMYTLSQFLYKANELVQANVSDEVIEEISSFSKNIPKIEIHGDFILECQQCRQVYSFPNDQMDVDYDVIYIGEREMGSEITYEWKEYPNCPNCGANHIVTCRVWEFPFGINNYEEFEVEGASIIEEPMINVNAI